MTLSPELVRTFQRAHVGPTGAPLAVDGVCGPMSQWARDVVDLPIERQLAIRRAQRHMGLVESPPASNRDAAGLIAQWLEACGLGRNVAAPWCAAALCEWLALPGVRTASALGIGRRFPATASPCAGDVMWYPTGGAAAGTGHCGLVIGVSDGEVMTIEGNCDNAVRCVRRPRAGLHFARTPWAPADGRGPSVVRHPSIPERAAVREGTR